MNCIVDNLSKFAQAEGTYGVKANLPAVGGNEGVAVVKEVSRFDFMPNWGHDLLVFPNFSCRLVLE